MSIAQHLPAELIYNIMGTLLGSYFSDLILRPHLEDDWDALLVLLHVSQKIRACTINMLFHAGGNTFVDPETR